MSRVLFSACSGYGHVHPLLPLAAAYRRAGHEVVMATGPDLAPVVEQHGLPAWSVGLTMGDAERSFRARFPHSDALPPTERLPLVLAEMFVAIAARQRAVDLVPLVDRWRPDVVVHDVSEFAAPVAAARVGAATVVHGISCLNATEPAIAAVRPHLDALSSEWGVADGSARLLDSPFLDLCPPSLALPLANPFPDVRPLRPQLPAGSAATWPGQLDALPFDRTVLVTLGTVVNTSPELFETIVAGVAGLPVNLVVTVGPDVDPARLGRQPAHVHVARYLPYDGLLPRCTAVVAHAGAGTLFASLAEGLPSVLVPQGAEQVANGLAAQASGAAVTVLPDDLTAAAARAALVQVLEDESYRSAARRIAGEIAAMPTADEVVRALERRPAPAVA
jgi:UDP:flavonoid glycosyltransferase YjiC (YdhE family)